MSPALVRYGLPGALTALVLYVVIDAGAQADWFVAWVAAWSMVTLVLYGVDKALSKTRATRVPEVLLHLFAVAGGFVGGWVGRASLRHKTRHRGFTVVLSISTLAWLGVAVWWYWLR